MLKKLIAFFRVRNERKLRKTLVLKLITHASDVSDIDELFLYIRIGKTD
jgi:hypothetical protein